MFLVAKEAKNGSNERFDGISVGTLGCLDNQTGEIFKINFCFSSSYSCRSTAVAVTRL